MNRANLNIMVEWVDQPIALLANIVASVSAPHPAFSLSN